MLSAEQVVGLLFRSGAERGALVWIKRVDDCTIAGPLSDRLGQSDFGERRASSTG